MTTEELLALRKEKEAQVANMSIEQVINGLKNDDPLFGLVARLYVARCMEWATGVAGETSQVPEQVQKAIKAAEEAARQAGLSENWSDISKNWAEKAKTAAGNLGDLAEQGQLLLQLLNDTAISDNKAAYLAFLSRAAVPTVFKLMTSTGVIPIAPETVEIFKDYDKQEYNAVLSPVAVHADADGMITFSDDCELLISAKNGYSLSPAREVIQIVHTGIDYYNVDTSSWANLTMVSNDQVGAGGLSQVIPSVLFSYKKGMKLRYYAQNRGPYNVLTAGKGNATYIQFTVLPKIDQFPTADKPVIIDTGEIDEAVQSAEKAVEAAQEAEKAAQTAETAAAELSQAVPQTQEAAKNAEGSETASKSWAVGGTQTRDGEETDNAKYWAGQAQHAAGGGVTSFHNRSGVVIPEAGDYTADQVGADAAGSADAALTEAKSYTDTLRGDLQETVEDLVSEKADTADIMDGVPELYGRDETAKPKDILSQLSKAALLTKTPMNKLVTYRLSEAAPGDVVYLKEGGEMVPFYIAHVDYESELNGTGNVLLVRKDIHSTCAWHNVNTNAYATSDVDAWLNGEYKGLLDGHIQSAMKTAAFRYTVGGADATLTTLRREVFLLSLTEMGLANTYAQVEGSAVQAADLLRIATRNRVAGIQWTRTPRYNNATIVLVLTVSGAASTANPSTATNGVRPAFLLPHTLTLSWYERNGRVYGEQEYTDVVTDATNSLSIPITGFAKIETGSYYGTGTFGAASPNTLQFDFEPKMIFVGSDRSYLQAWAMRGVATSQVINVTSAYNLTWNWDGNSVSFYNTNNASYQFNDLNAKFVYTAIG